MSSSPSYLNKDIPEWSNIDLSNWLLDNKFKKISELCKKNNITGYDLFFINEEILKTEFGLISFHERISTLKALKKLIYAHLKLNIKNMHNGEQKTIILDNNLNTSLENITKSIGNIFNINPDDIIYKDLSQRQIISPTIKIVELMILFPKLYKCLNICNIKEKQNSKNDYINQKNRKIKSKNNINNIIIEKDYDIKENCNKVKHDFKVINKVDNEIINNNKNNSKDINSNENKNNINSGSNSSSFKPSIELYINDNENNDLNEENEIIQNNENKRYDFNKNNQINQNNKKVIRYFPDNKSNNNNHLLNFDRTKSFKEKNKKNKENIHNSIEKDKKENNNIYKNELYNKKRYLNIQEGLLIEDSYYMDKNESSNEGENRSKIYLNNIIKNNGDNSEYSIRNNSFPSMSYSDKINNNHNDNKMDLRYLNNENQNENDAKPLNMKQSYKGPQKNRVFNEDIIGGDL